MSLFLNYLRRCEGLLITGVLGAQPICISAQELVINSFVWSQLSISDRASISEKYKSIEIAPLQSIGFIQSVQVANRSTAGTNFGAVLGSAAGQAAYVDRAFSGSNSYSATNHLGAALLGGALGSTLDKGPQSRFEFNYAIRTPDGNLIEHRVVSSDELHRPIGSCVFLSDMRLVSAIACSPNKADFIRTLSTLPGTSSAEAKATPTHAVKVAIKKVSCRVPNVGLITLEREICLSLEGKEE